MRITKQYGAIEVTESSAGLIEVELLDTDSYGHSVDLDRDDVVALRNHLDKVLTGVQNGHMARATVTYLDGVQESFVIDENTKIMTNDGCMAVTFGDGDSMLVPLFGVRSVYQSLTDEGKARQG